MLKLNEAEFLLLMGAERLRLFGDVGATLEAYRLADATLASMDDPLAAGLRLLLALARRLLGFLGGLVVFADHHTDDVLVDWKGQPTLGRKPYEVAHLGIGYVPESRAIFPTLTVHQNLMLGQKSAKQKGRWSFDDMYGMFPRLKEREAQKAGEGPKVRQTAYIVSRAHKQAALGRVLMEGDPYALVPSVTRIVRELSPTRPVERAAVKAYKIASVDPRDIQVMGQLKMVNPPTADLQRGQDGLFRMNNGAPAPADPSVRMVSGFIEKSNVNPAEAMVAMIANARRFETQMKVIQDASAREDRANSLLSFNG